MVRNDATNIQTSYQQSNKQTNKFDQFNVIIFFITIQLKHTPLHWAVEEDYRNLVQLLLKYGADPYAESKAGETPLSIAHQLRFDDLWQIMSTYKQSTSVSMREQQEATDSLMQEMEKDSLSSFKHSDVDISQDSISCDDNSSANINLKTIMDSSNQQQNCKSREIFNEHFCLITDFIHRSSFFRSFLCLWISFNIKVVTRGFNC